MTTQQITVVGSFGARQRVLAELYPYQERKVPLNAHLEREPANQYDGNAIAVYLGSVDRGLTHIGYIPRELAADLAPQIDVGATVEITRVRINRDWSKGYPVHEVKLTLAVGSPERRPAYAEVNEVGF